MSDIRVQKYLSQAGLCSRRTAEEWMLEGRVKVNNTICRLLGTKIDPLVDKIEVDGKLVVPPESHVYLLLNKPQGYITSLHDPEGRPVITDLLPPRLPRVWPVGRLDWNSEGLILLTNDGKLTNLLTHPSQHLTKRYAVKIQGVLAEDSPLLEQLRAGLDIGEGEVTLPAHVSVTRIERNTWLEVIITEGRNRQIRRMFDAIGHPVMKLRRIGIGPLSIEGLRSGTYRSLALNEVLSIYEDMETEAPEAAIPSKRQLKREAQERERDGDKPRARSVGGGRAAAAAARAKSKAKPQSAHPQSDERAQGGKPQRDGRPSSAKPQGHTYGERPQRGERPQSNDRPRSDRPQRDERPQSNDRPRGERPQPHDRPRGDKPQGAQAQRPQQQGQGTRQKPQGARQSNKPASGPRAGGSRGPRK